MPSSRSRHSSGSAHPRLPPTRGCRAPSRSGRSGAALPPTPRGMAPSEWRDEVERRLDGRELARARRAAGRRPPATGARVRGACVTRAVRRQRAGDPAQHAARRFGRVGRHLDVLEQVRAAPAPDGDARRGIGPVIARAAPAARAGGRSTLSSVQVRNSSVSVPMLPRQRHEAVGAVTITAGARTGRACGPARAPSD